MNDDLLREILAAAKDILQTNQDGNATLSRINDSTESLHKDMEHLSGQIDILSHSLYVQNQYSMWAVICLMLLTALVMFAVGYNISRK
jgi:hypothetical protein